MAKDEMNSKDIFSFVQLSRAWYGKDNLETMKDHVADEIIVMLNAGRDEEGLTYGHFTIEWTILNRKTRESRPEIRSLDDSWMALSKCTGLIEELAKLDSQSSSPEQVIEVLKKLGMKDVTPTKRFGEMAYLLD